MTTISIKKPRMFLPTVNFKEEVKYSITEDMIALFETLATNTNNIK